MDPSREGAPRRLEWTVLRDYCGVPRFACPCVSGPVRLSAQLEGNGGHPGPSGGLRGLHRVSRLPGLRGRRGLRATVGLRQKLGITTAVASAMPTRRTRLSFPQSVVRRPFARAADQGLSFDGRRVVEDSLVAHWEVVVPRRTVTSRASVCGFTLFTSRVAEGMALRHGRYRTRGPTRGQVLVLVLVVVGGGG